MIRLGGIFSGRNGPGTGTAPDGQGVTPDPDADTLTARLREAVSQGAVAPATATGLPGSHQDVDHALSAPEPLPDDATPIPLDASDAAASFPPDLDLSQITLPAASGSARRSGRVRTRLLGFDATQAIDPDPIDAARVQVADSAPAGFPVGWIVVIRGPGRGTAFTLCNGVNQIGRGPDQPVRLDFGDTSISRSNHAAIAYDDEGNSFFIGHGGKANLVRLNDRPVVSTEVLHDRDVIRIGDTALLFVSLCREDFRWQDEGADGRG